MGTYGSSDCRAPEIWEAWILDAQFYVVKIPLHTPVTISADYYYYYYIKVMFALSYGENIHERANENNMLHCIV